VEVKWFGFDLMLDRSHRLWLLEINHGPCFPIEDHHPLQRVLYDEFWRAMLNRFVLPIMHHQAIPWQDDAYFERIDLV
jgi:tubulin--tyrosine ligase